METTAYVSFGHYFKASDLAKPITYTQFQNYLPKDPHKLCIVAGACAEQYILYDKHTHLNEIEKKGNILQLKADTQHSSCVLNLLPKFDTAQNKYVFNFRLNDSLKDKITQEFKIDMPPKNFKVSELNIEELTNLLAWVIIAPNVRDAINRPIYIVWRNTCHVTEFIAQILFIEWFLSKTHNIDLSGTVYTNWESIRNGGQLLSLYIENPPESKLSKKVNLIEMPISTLLGYNCITEQSFVATMTIFETRNKPEKEKYKPSLDDFIEVEISAGRGMHNDFMNLGSSPILELFYSQKYIEGTANVAKTDPNCLRSIDTTDLLEQIEPMFMYWKVMRSICRYFGIHQKKLNENRLGTCIPQIEKLTKHAIQIYTNNEFSAVVNLIKEKTALLFDELISLTPEILMKI